MVKDSVMKRNHIIFAMAALSFAVSACENNRDNALPGATACFLAEGVLESAPFYVVDEDPAVTLRVFRSGYYAESLTVSVRSSESALETYNSENATAYKALPQSAYRIEPERITLAGDERSGAFQVIFDPMQLVGVEDPEKKRKIIGHTFIDVFDEEARAIGNVEWLAQGTLYPDVIESVSHKGPSAVIKSHHNVGGLPEKMNMKLIEPLRELFKDEVRQVGAELGMPESVIWRQPFPGPGLAIRVIGEVTRERLDILRKADAIVQQELRDAGWYRKIWQGFAVLLPLKTVGVMGDGRTYEHVIALRCVDSVDAMTADWARLPYDLLERISRRIINEVKGVNRVVYDVSSKPPSTIEWE